MAICINAGDDVMTFAEMLLREDAWAGLMMGNHALVRAMLESGVLVATTYPGSPTPEIADAIRAIPAERRPLYFQYSTNEKVALEVAFGASINGHLSTVFFKSVGLNVAADSAVQLGLLNLIGGMVIVLGDDPGANSSQNEQDNRHFARMAYIPMLEPATPGEAYAMFKEAVNLSRKYQSPVFLRMTTHVCHAREVIQFAAYRPGKADWTPRFDVNNGPYLPLTSQVFPLKTSALARLRAMETESTNSRFNTILSPNGSRPVNGRRLGVISASMPVLSLRENIEKTGHAIDILQIHFSHPLPGAKLLDFLNNHDEVIVIEELDRVMELEIKALAWDNSVTCKILARKDDDDLMKELGPQRTWKILSDYWPELFPPRELKPAPIEVSPRLAQMCPGCGHRSAFHAIKQALPEDAITVGDIGCHSLGFFEPYLMGQMLLSMGHSNATAAGLSIGNQKRKVLSFIGDSTFFHAGIPAIINAILYNHNFTLVVMENGTTAMTGHQPHAGSGEIGERVPIIEVLKTLGVKFIRDVDTYNQKKLTEYVREALEFEGFAVVIARHPCMLKFVREQRRKGVFKAKPVKISQADCDRHYTCLQEFGCPTFTLHEDGSVTAHEDLCIGDGSCIQTCPVQAIGFEKKEVKS